MALATGLCQEVTELSEQAPGGELTENCEVGLSARGSPGLVFRGVAQGVIWGQKRCQGLRLNLWTPVLLHVGGASAATSLGRQSRLKAQVCSTLVAP